MHALHGKLKVVMLHVRGALISKLAEIPITNVSAIKSTNYNTTITTSMDSSLLLLQILQI